MHGINQSICGVVFDITPSIHIYVMPEIIYYLIYYIISDAACQYSQRYTEAARLISIVRLSQ